MRISALLLAALFAVPTVALAGHATANLDGIEEAIEDRIAELADLANGEFLSPNEVRCKKAFERAKAILEKNTLTAVADQKLLKKVEKALRKWFPVEPEMRQKLRASSDLFDLKATVLGLDIRDGLNRLERKKDIDRLEKQLDKLDKRLLQVAAETDLKRHIKLAGQALKLAGKAFLAFEKAPKQAPRTSATRSAVATGKDGNGVLQVFAIDFAGDGGAPVPRQLSTGNEPVSELKTIERDGKLVVVYRQDGDVFGVDVRDPDARPANLTNDGATEGHSVSPLGDRVVVADSMGEYRIFDLDESDDGSSLGTFTGPTIGEITWFPDGKSFSIRSIELPGKSRIDAVVLKAGTPAVTPIAGGTIDDSSAGDETVSPDGRYMAFTYIPPTGAGTRLCVVDLTTGERKEIHDSVVVMESDQSFFRSRTVAGAWISPTQFVFNGVPGLWIAEFPNGVDSVVFDILDVNGRAYTVHGQSETDLFVHDGHDGEMLHVDSGSLATTVIGDPGSGTPSSALLEVVRTFIFSNTNAGGALEILKYEAKEKRTTVLETIENDPVKALQMFLRDLRVQADIQSDSDTALSYNISSNDTSKAGVYVSMFRVLRGEFRIDRITDSLRVFEQGAEEEVQGVEIILGLSPSGELGVTVAVSVLSFLDGSVGSKSQEATYDGEGIEIIGGSLFDLFGTFGFHYYF